MICKLPLGSVVTVVCLGPPLHCIPTILYQLCIPHTGYVCTVYSLPLCDILTQAVVLVVGGSLYVRGPTTL